MNMTTKLGLCVLALTALATAWGCQGTTKAGTQYTQLPNRALQTILSADIATVHANSVKVLRDEFGYNLEKESKDALEGVIEARTARNERVTVETFKDGDHSTKIRVSTGFMSGDWKARELLSRIEQVSLEPAAAAKAAPAPTAPATAAKPAATATKAASANK